MTVAANKKAGALYIVTKEKKNCKFVLLEQIRVITKILGCWVYVISRQGIEQLEFSSSISLKIKDGDLTVGYYQ